MVWDSKSVRSILQKTNKFCGSITEDKKIKFVTKKSKNGEM